MRVLCVKSGKGGQNGELHWLPHESDESHEILHHTSAHFTTFSFMNTSTCASPLSSANACKMDIDFLVSPSPAPPQRVRKVKTNCVAVKRPLRSGGWTAAELEYTFRLSTDFKDGLVTDAPPGILLRQYLSMKLNCSPMRLSKKFDKTSGILGMHRFDPTASVLLGITPEMRRVRRRELKQLEEAFRKHSIDVIDTSVTKKRRPLKPQAPLRVMNALDLLAVACMA